jgi:hypothetical protein
VPHQQRLDQCPATFEQVLAIVENQQRMPLPQRIEVGAHLQIQGAGQMIDHVRRVIDHRQIHPPHAVTVMLQQQFGDSHGHGGLADAARPDQGHEAPYRQLPHQAADHRIATGDRCQARGQVVLWFLQVFEGDGRGRDLAHRCDEAVTTLGNVDDVT